MSEREGGRKAWRAIESEGEGVRALLDGRKRFKDKSRTAKKRRILVKRTEEYVCGSSI